MSEAQSADLAVRKPFPCRLGFHQTFGDTILRNYGDSETPMFFAETYETCNRCGWTARPNRSEGDQ